MDGMIACSRGSISTISCPTTTPEGFLSPYPAPHRSTYPSHDSPSCKGSKEQLTSPPSDTTVQILTVSSTYIFFSLVAGSRSRRILLFSLLGSGFGRSLLCFPALYVASTGHGRPQATSALVLHDGRFRQRLVPYHTMHYYCIPGGCRPVAGESPFLETPVKT